MLLWRSGITFDGKHDGSGFNFQMKKIISFIYFCTMLKCGGKFHCRIRSEEIRRVKKGVFCPVNAGSKILFILELNSQSSYKVRWTNNTMHCGFKHNIFIKQTKTKLYAT